MDVATAKFDDVLVSEQSNLMRFFLGASTSIAGAASCVEGRRRVHPRRHAYPPARFFGIAPSPLDVRS